MSYCSLIHWLMLLVLCLKMCSQTIMRVCAYRACKMCLLTDKYVEPYLSPNPSQGGYYNINNPLVKEEPPYIHRPSPARWRPVNMLGHPFYHVIISVVTWGLPHIHWP